MPDPTKAPRGLLGKQLFVAICALLTFVACVLWPSTGVATAQFVASGLVSVAPLVIPGIVLTAWVMASGADASIAGVFQGRLLYSIVAASAIGAITPVCGVTVLPMMAGLLVAGVPFAPVMAFWLSSPHHRPQRCWPLPPQP